MTMKLPFLSSKFNFKLKKFKIAPQNLDFPHEKLIFLSKNSNFAAFLFNICCTGTGTGTVSIWAVLVLLLIAKFWY